jgi:hypothetical protein
MVNHVKVVQGIEAWLLNVAALPVCWTEKWLQLVSIEYLCLRYLEASQCPACSDLQVEGSRWTVI